MTDEELAALQSEVCAAESVHAEMRARLDTELLRRAQEACLLKVGDIVGALNYKQKPDYVITRIGISYGRVAVYGRRILKSGDLGKAERKIWWKVEKIGYRGILGGV